MKQLLQKILNNPLLSLGIWILLLLTKFIITNALWGTIVELGGALMFIISIMNWSKNKKTTKK